MKREKNRISATNAGSVPLCIVIAGPNGAGKTTFATEYLVHEAGVLHFINVDLIAGGLSPLQPELANVFAGRIFLEQWSRLVSARASFAFETTMSGLTLSRRLCALRTAGYRVTMIFLKLSSPELALRRVAARVKQGGHHVPEKDVVRRFARGWENFVQIYRPLADAWAVYDNSEAFPRLLEFGP